MTQVNSEDVCRLCGRANGIHINLFDSTSECISKIEAVVPDIVILRNDSLSKMVCHRCVAKVKEFYDFKELCIQTQSLLKNKLSWMSSSGSNVAQGVVSPVIMYMGGPLAYPFGHPEPEVEILTLSDDEDYRKTTASQNSHPTSLINKSQYVKRSSEGNQFKTTPSRGPPAGRPVRRRNGFSAGAVQSPGMQSVQTSRNDSTVHYSLHQSVQSSRTSQAATSSSVGHQRLSTGPGPSSTALPSHPFRSFVQFQQSLAAVNTNQSIHPQGSYSAPKSLSALPPAPKRTRLLGTDQNRVDQSARDVPTLVRKRPVPGTSAVVAMPGPSNILKKNTTAGLPPVPDSVPIRSTKTFPQLNSYEYTPVNSHAPTVEPRISSIHSNVPALVAVNTAPVVSRISSVNSNVLAPVTVNASPLSSVSSDVPAQVTISALPAGPRISSVKSNVPAPGVPPPVDPKLSSASSTPQTTFSFACDSTVKAEKPQKPKPKSKKKPVMISEADTHRICQTYPKIDSVKICENTFIFTCTLCNKILMNEEAISNHECVTAANPEIMNDQNNGQPFTNKCDQLLNHSENSNHSTSSCVELSSDDELSNSNLAMKHSCIVCHKEFHNLARLQKHEVSHVSEVS